MNRPTILEVLSMAEATIERLTPRNKGPFTSTQGTLDVIRAAKETAAAPAALISAMLQEFPGFITEADVNGGDLVEWLNDMLRRSGLLPDVERLQVCPDCLQVVENCTADLDADREGEIMVAIERRTSTGATLHVSAGYEAYSTAPCQLCGSALHGERHTVTLFKA